MYYNDLVFLNKEDGTLEVSGKKGYNSIIELKIPEEVDGRKVTSIGNYAFSEWKYLKKVSMPDTIISIGDSAFDFCKELESIVIPDSVTNIGASAFHFCENLHTVVLPNSLTVINESTFFSCESLTTIKLPDSLINIEKRAFAFCKSLKSIVIPDKVESVGDEAFAACESLENATFGESLNSIGKKVFCGCLKLEPITNNAKNKNIASLNNKKINAKFSFIEKVIGYIGAIIDVFLPVLMILGATVFFLSSLLSVEDKIDSILIFSLISIGAMTGVLYLVFYNGIGAILISFKSVTTLISYNGSTYAIDARGGNVNIRKFSGTGFGLFLIAINLLINFAIIHIMFFKNLILFTIYLFIPSKRVKLIENGHDFFDRIKETHKAFIIFFSIDIVIGLINLVFFLTYL